MLMFIKWCIEHDCNVFVLLHSLRHHRCGDFAFRFGIAVNGLLNKQMMARCAVWQCHVQTVQSGSVYTPFGNHYLKKISHSSVQKKEPIKQPAKRKLECSKMIIHYGNFITDQALWNISVGICWCTAVTATARTTTATTLTPSTTTALYQKWKCSRGNGDSAASGEQRTIISDIYKFLKHIASSIALGVRSFFILHAEIFFSCNFFPDTLNRFFQHCLHVYIVQLH